MISVPDSVSLSSREVSIHPIRRCSTFTVPDYYAIGNWGENTVFLTRDRWCSPTVLLILNSSGGMVRKVSVDTKELCCFFAAAFWSSAITFKEMLVVVHSHYRIAMEADGRVRCIRGMEGSEIVPWNGRLISLDDDTVRVWDIATPSSIEDGREHGYIRALQVDSFSIPYCESLCSSALATIGGHLVVGFTDGCMLVYSNDKKPIHTLEYPSDVRELETNGERDPNTFFGVTCIVTWGDYLAAAYSNEVVCLWSKDWVAWRKIFNAGRRLALVGDRLVSYDGFGPMHRLWEKITWSPSTHEYYEYEIRKRIRSFVVYSRWGIGLPRDITFAILRLAFDS